MEADMTMTSHDAVRDTLRPGRAPGRIAPTKLAHVVLRVRDLPAMRDWYKTVLQADVTQESAMLSFLTFDDEHHRIALVAVPGIAERDDTMRVGLDHMAFTYASVADLLTTYERLRDAGITPFWPINHGVTMSLYYRDPEGNRIELQVDAFATMDEAKAYMRSDAFKANPIGVLFEPEALLRRFKAGEPAESLLRQPPLPDGKTPMDMLRL
jgi:catechol-2,3-dioxygenase